MYVHPVLIFGTKIHLESLNLNKFTSGYLEHDSLVDYVDVVRLFRDVKAEMNQRLFHQQPMHYGSAIVAMANLACSQWMVSIYLILQVQLVFVKPILAGSDPLDFRF